MDSMFVEITAKIKFALSEKELYAIKKRIEDIDFFSYPVHFKTKPSTENMTSGVRYYYKITYCGRVKELDWESSVINRGDIKSENLRSLHKLIADILWLRPEIQELMRKYIWDREPRDSSGVIPD
ncbi:MAG: hypothetical protein QMD50_02810 [Patescibacteria group bacterium]|nr:hypothetical protein [Patescibacteria group bacterium]